MINLENIQIILVETTHPGNVGAAARAMKNMCLENLVLVNPQCKIGEIAYSRSSGAHSVLDNMQRFDTLKQAVAESNMVFGASARIRSMSMPMVDPEQASQEISNLKSDDKISIVFGREHSGLTNEEMDLCHYALHIATNERFSSLNVAAAVQVVCYEFFKNAHGIQNTVNEEFSDRANMADIEGLIKHLEHTLIDIDFLDPMNPKLLIKRLTQLSMRQQLTQNEVAIFRGVLTAINKKIER